MKNGISPEERLLNLIKNQKNEHESGMASTRTIAGVKQETVGIPDTNEITGYLLNNQFSFPRLRRALKLILAVSLIYLLYTFIYPFLPLKEPVIKGPLAVKAMSLRRLSGDGGRPWEFYLKGMQGKQVFIAKTPGLISAGLAMNSNDTELLREISLVGIIGGDDPQAAIEDKKIQKTYYLKKNQFIRQYQIEDIQEGKVILGYRGENFELYL